MLSVVLKNFMVHAHPIPISVGISIISNDSIVSLCWFSTWPSRVRIPRRLTSDRCGARHAVGRDEVVAAELCVVVLLGQEIKELIYTFKML